MGINICRRGNDGGRFCGVGVWQNGAQSPFVCQIALDLLAVGGGEDAIKCNQFSYLTLGCFTHITVAPRLNLEGW